MYAYINAHENVGLLMFQEKNEEKSSVQEVIAL